MKRGEIWSVASGSGYAGKPRPTLIIQDDRFDGTDSITSCGFTTEQIDAPLFRILIQPDMSNRLNEPSRVMIDKIVTVPRAKIGKRIGRLSDGDMVRVDRAILVFLGLAA